VGELAKDTQHRGFQHFYAPTFSSSRYGFSPDRSAHDAISAAWISANSKKRMMDKVRAITP
jgi:retron-type reverse transcriptase